LVINTAAGSALASVAGHRIHSLLVSSARYFLSMVWVFPSVGCVRQRTEPRQLLSSSSFFSVLVFVFLVWLSFPVQIGCPRVQIFVTCKPKGAAWFHFLVGAQFSVHIGGIFLVFVEMPKKELACVSLCYDEYS
jgi:hypothetical protein